MAMSVYCRDGGREKGEEEEDEVEKEKSGSYSGPRVSWCVYKTGER